MDLIPALKQEILKQELGIEVQAPVDSVNNTNHDPNVGK